MALLFQIIIVYYTEYAGKITTRTYCSEAKKKLPIDGPRKIPKKTIIIGADQNFNLLTKLNHINKLQISLIMLLQTHEYLQLLNQRGLHMLVPY